MYVITTRGEDVNTLLWSHIKWVAELREDDRQDVSHNGRVESADHSTEFVLACWKIVSEGEFFERKQEIALTVVLLPAVRWNKENVLKGEVRGRNEVQ